LKYLLVKTEVQKKSQDHHRTRRSAMAQKIGVEEVYHPRSSFQNVPQKQEKNIKIVNDKLANHAVNFFNRSQAGKCF
jgi:hypothetical protein